MQGLKTGMYYLRTKPAANALQFTVDKTRLQKSSAIDNTVTNVAAKQPETKVDDYESVLACSRENGDACMSCGA